jgi:hypothetical protein
LGCFAGSEECADKSDEAGKRLNSSAAHTKRLVLSICNSRSLDLAVMIGGTGGKLDDTL